MRRLAAQSAITSSYRLLAEFLKSPHGLALCFAAFSLVYLHNDQSVASKQKRLMAHGV